MAIMSFIRRSIIAPFSFLLLLNGVVSFIIFYLTNEYIVSLNLRALIAIGSFLILTWITFYLKIHTPLKKIIREMKALLTGNTYRRIMTHKRNEIGVLAHFFNEVTRNLEKISSDVKSHERIRKELNAAQLIQKNLLPIKAPDIIGLEVVAKTRPASEIGGDTFDFYPHPERTLLYIGDSTGHGVPAGIVMVMVDTLLETFIDIHDNISEIMINLNKYIKPHLQTTMFMTMILMEWLPKEMALNGSEPVMNI